MMVVMISTRLTSIRQGSLAVGDLLDVVWTGRRAAAFDEACRRA